MIEAKIDELIAAINRLTAAVGPAGPSVTDAAPVKTSSKPKASKASATEPAQPAAALAPQPPPAAEPPAPSPAAPSSPKADPKLLLTMTNAVIRLANEYDHETAVALLAKRNVKRCAEVPESEWQAVLDEAEEAIAKAQAAQATASLV